MNTKTHKIKFIGKKDVIKYYTILLTSITLISFLLSAIDMSVYKVISFI